MKKLSFVLSFILASCTSYKGKGSFTVKKDISYKQTPQEERSLGDVYIPDGNGPFPGVAVVHGGGWQSRSKSDMDSIAESLASHGYAVFNINYRLAPQYHHPAPLEDLDTALNFFKSHASEYKLNTAKIALWGYSSGAHTVSLYALTKKNVQAVVSGGAPYDLTWYTKSPYVKAYTGYYRDEAFDEYIEASPAYQISSEAPPFFIYQAEEDKLVEHSQATAFEAKLKMAKVPVKRYDIGFWGHTTAFIFSSEAVKRGILFLDKTLAKNN